MLMACDIAASTDGARLTTIARELSSRLAALSTSSEVLDEDFDALDRTEITEMVARIHRGALTLQGLVENLLCAAVSTRGRLYLRKVPLDVSDVVAEIRPALEPLLQARSQSLRVVARRPIPRVEADARRLGQLLMNLVLAASAAGPPGSRIELMLKSEKGRLRVTVGDRGPDLSADRGATPLGPNWEWSTDDADEAPGLELGLEVAWAIVHAHGGSIGTERLGGSGGGRQFWFELPGLRMGSRARVRSLAATTGD